MTVAGEDRVIKYARRHPNARPWLDNWLTVAAAAAWQNIAAVKANFPSTDGGVRVHSGGLVTVFDVGGNHHRMITFINYRAQRLTILELMTHAEYSKDLWKERY